MKDVDSVERDSSPGERGRKGGATLFPLSLFHMAAIGCVQMALISWLVGRPLWIPVFLAAFLGLCMVGPFVQRMQFFLPIVTRGNRQSGAVALTFDDGPDPDTTRALLDLLDAKGVKATFFVVGEKVRRHPDLVEDILARGHEIGNHSESHDVFLMFRRPRTLAAEVRGGLQSLERFGIRPLAFRPPVGVTNPHLWRVLLEEGMYCAGFSRRAPDMGNFWVTGLARRILRRLKPGDVVLLHDCRPWKPQQTGLWLEEVGALVDGIRERGTDIRLFSELVQRPVMETLSSGQPSAVVTFYDSMARSGYYRDRTPAAMAEEAWVSKVVEPALRPEDRVLEIGAGMGRFTLRIAPRVSRVRAVDISSGSLEVLRKRAEEQGVGNVSTEQSDMSRFVSDGFFDVVCSFSAFEYVADLESLLAVAVGHLEPGGRLFFTMAHRSFFRLFAQIGNAMRQGMWLHARSRRRVLSMLHSLDLEEISVSDLGMKTALTSGLILAVAARKRAG